MVVSPKTDSVAGYLARLGREQRVALQKLRRAIRAAAPQAQEGISYGIPAYRVGGKLLVAFGAAARHCAFYPGALPIRTHRAELKAYATAKGTVRFQVARPLPAALVRKLVKTRLAQRAAKRAVRPKR